MCSGQPNEVNKMWASKSWKTSLCCRRRFSCSCLSCSRLLLSLLDGKTLKNYQSSSGGRRRPRRRNCIVSDCPIQAAPVTARAPPNSPNVTEENSTAPRSRQAQGIYPRRNEEEKHVCTLRCPASCQVPSSQLVRSSNI